MHKDILFDDASKYLDAFEPDKAEEILNQLLEVEPDNVKYLNKLGVAYILKKQLFEAENQFRRVLEINPDYAPAIVNLGNLCQEVEDYDNAMMYYEEASRKDPDYPMSYYNMAIVLKKKNEYYAYSKQMKKYKRLLRRYYADQDNEVRILAKRRIGCLPAMLLIAVSVLLLVLLIQ